jgi:PleD family two-component response regulator
MKDTIPILLVISDKAHVRRWIKKHLSQDFHIMEDVTCTSAYNTALRHDLSFIILDAQTKDSSPLSLCKRIRSIEKMKEVPILLITGRLKKSYRTKALQSGVTEFLQDILDEKELLKRIDTSQKNISRNNKIATISRPVIKRPNIFYDKTIKNKKAQDLLQSFQKNKKPLSLLVIEITNYNDINVKEEKEESLNNHIAAAIEEVLSHNDILLPSDIGKFIVITPSDDKDKISSLAEKIHNKLTMTSTIIDNKKIMLTASIILTTYTNMLQIQNISSDKGFDKILSAATHALKGKEKQKNIIWMEIKE